MLNKKMISITAAAILAMTPAIAVRAESVSQNEKSTETEDTTESASEERAADTEPVSGIAHAKSYEELYDVLQKWQENLSSGNTNARVMMVEETAMDAAASSDTASSDSMTASKSDDPIDTAFDYDETAAEGDFSSTNTQEENVDEADIVRTDGTYIYAMGSRGDVRIVDAKSMKLVGEIPGENSSDYKEMYVDGGCLQIICQKENYITYKDELELPSADSSESIRSSYSVPIITVSVETYDITDRANPKKTGTYQQDGYYLSSRRNNGKLYLFTSYTPDTGKNSDQIQYYVPRTNEEYIDCDHIYFPVEDPSENYSGSQMAYLVAGAIAAEYPDKATDIMAVVSGAETFYVSENNIYSAVSVYNQKENRTEIVRIGYENGKFKDGSTGSVSGELNNNFSMDEYDGNLRVVTTTESWGEDYSDFSRSNGLYVLNNKMETIGKIENLAEGEEIKSARFMGNTGYFVTYRNTDPLFAVDLSEPEEPEILGELKITGFSEYLHFYGENQLLGIGWETDPDTGSTEGLKCSMFDISDPADIRETDRFVLKDTSFCDALSNYRSILVAPKKNIFGFAYGMFGSYNNSYDSGERYYYAVFNYSEDEGFLPATYLNLNDCGLFEDGISYSDYQTTRGIYIKDVFYLVTQNGIVSYDMNDDYSHSDALKWKK